MIRNYKKVVVKRNLFKEEPCCICREPAGRKIQLADMASYYCSGHGEWVIARFFGKPNLKHYGYMNWRAAMVRDQEMKGQIALVPLALFFVIVAMILTALYYVGRVFI